MKGSTRDSEAAREKTGKDIAGVQVREQEIEDGSRAAAGFSAAHRKEVRPKAKYHVIYRHQQEYPVAVMCRFFGVSRSGYYDFLKRLGKPEHDEALGKAIEE